MDSDSIYQSIVEFNNYDGAVMKSALASRAKYFPHSIVDGKTLFCLSKFCQFEGASLPSYIGLLRRSAKGGGQVKDDIARIMKPIKWIRYGDSDKRIQESFKRWVFNFYPEYNIQNAHFISINSPSRLKPHHKIRKKQTQDDFLEALEQKRAIGEIGEEIALKYEYDRLKSLGCTEPSKFVLQVSKEDQGAGYDILSNYNNNLRLIEVKATTGDLNTFFISSNELEVLASSPKEAFIYIVKVTSIKAKMGQVKRELADPLASIISKEPILFKVTVK